MTIFAPDTAPTHAHVESTHAGVADDTAPPAVTADEPAPDEPAAIADAPGEHAAESTRRPTKFLADLTRAMQAAAEQARTATLEQYHADSTAVIEEIHGASATSVDELRRRADEDVAGIKDWSKAEIARIREETERRIGDRREQLEGQLERHAALVEHQIEGVRGQIAAFEEAMGRFFDELLGEEDPARFAARAASLPEPPSFSAPDEDALQALLAEPGIGVPPPAEPEPPEPQAADDQEDSTPVEPEAALLVADGVDAGEPAVVEASAETVDEALAVESIADDGAPAAEPFDRDAALAAIQAAAEAAAASEAAEVQAERAEAAADRAEAVVLEPGAGEPAADQAEPTAASAPEGEHQPDAAEPEAAVADGPESSDAFGAPVSGQFDPRLAMLGLEPDFAAAAEAAAAEAAAADADDVPEIGGDLLAARLSGLLPDEAPAAPSETTTTQVTTSGLVSVASIASFKRHLGRLAGVTHVGVSSGPDGEFVFAVEHETSTSLRDLVPTIPGFGARVTNAGEGTLQVSAQDPQD